MSHLTPKERKSFLDQLTECTRKLERARVADNILPQEFNRDRLRAYKGGLQQRIRNLRVELA